MQKNNRTLIILLALIIIGGVIYAYTKQSAKTKIQPTIEVTATATRAIQSSNVTVTPSAKIGPGLDSNTDLGIEFTTLANSIKDQSNGSYAKVCDAAKTYFGANTNTNIAGEILQTSKTTLTANNYVSAELKCKATVRDYILTIPFTREDKTPTKLCVSSTGVALGDGNFETISCIKKF